MMKQKISLEISKKDNLHQYILPPEASLGECFDVLTEYLQYVVEKMKSISETKREEKKEE